MKNRWLLYVIGFVRIQIEGNRIEIFLNEAMRKKIYIWEVKRTDVNILECNIKLMDIWKMKKLRKNTESTFTFVQTFGLPFQLKLLLLNKGFLLGIISFFTLLFILSNMVFEIRIKGATPVTEELIMKEINKLGIKKGAFKYQLDDPETIQKKILNQVPNVTWVGVQMNGTTYQFQVVEKEIPKEEKVIPPQHLIATKDAVITKIYSESGKTVVKPNQLIKKGQLLISGFIGKEDDTLQIPVAAKGEVLGETWYQSIVNVPLKTNFLLLTGNSQNKYYLGIGSFQLKVWGFEKTNYKQFKSDLKTKEFHFLKWKLPVSFISKQIFEKKEIERQYTLKEAVEVGKEIGEKELKKKLPKDAMIKEVKILRQTVSSGNARLSIYFVVEESIAVAKPIQ